MKSKAVSGIMVTLLFIGMLTLAFNIQPTEADPDGLTPHDPIFIDGDSGFTLENGVTGGSGTSDDPFIIENWDIDASTADGILIRDTYAHFVIRNVWVHDGDPNHHSGIVLKYVLNGAVEGTKITNNNLGIVSDTCIFINITGNYISNGILNGREGIVCWQSYYHNVVGNVISGLNYGITVEGHNNTFSRNKIFDACMHACKSTELTLERVL